MNLYQQISKNKRSTYIILVIFLFFFLLIGLGVDRFYGAGIKTPIFTIIAVIAAIAISYSGYIYGDRLILSSTHAQELDTSDLKQKEWQDVVEEMSIASNIPVPKTYLINDPDPNAFATGRNPQHASIAVTRGLLNSLSREELQAVAAHEMSHIKNLDVRLMLIVTVLVGSVALLADWASRMLFWGHRRDNNSGQKGSSQAILIVLVIWIVAVILSPILSQLVAMCVSRRREYLADASGAELTRNPLALASALEKISAHTEPTKSINRGTAHLCITDPNGNSLGAKEGWLADLFATHPPINKRIAILKELAYAA